MACRSRTIRSILYAIAGGVGGAMLIPLLAMAIRFAIQLVLLGLLGLAVYYAFFK